MLNSPSARTKNTDKPKKRKEKIPMSVQSVRTNQLRTTLGRPYTVRVPLSVQYTLPLSVPLSVVKSLKVDLSSSEIHISFNENNQYLLRIKIHSRLCGCFTVKTKQNK